MFSLILLAALLPSLLIVVNTLINKKEMLSREKSSPFECGFDPKSSARLPFSIRFYLIAIIFLIFDIEITLIMPLPFIKLLNNPSIWMIMMMVFITVLLAGLYHEWNQGALKWAQ